MAITVEFRVSGKTAEWSDNYDNLVELAGDNGIIINTECEVGVCGTCKVRMISGRVDMAVEDGLNDEDIDRNMILPCVAVPLTDVVLEI